MRLIGATLLLLTFVLGSCTSEYEERLAEAKLLKERFLLVEESNFVSPNHELVNEMQKLESEIQFLAKVSGNEEMFIIDLNKN